MTLIYLITIRRPCEGRVYWLPDTSRDDAQTSYAPPWSTEDPDVAERRADALPGHWRARVESRWVAR